MIHTVLISGKQGSGKTTLANALAKEFMQLKGWQCVVINFADIIYQIHDFARGKLTYLGLPPPASREVKDGPLLQYLGTEWGRSTYGENVWVDALRGRMNEIAHRLHRLDTQNLIFVIPDCRFKNELAGFPEALTVRLECDREVRKDRCSMWRENDTHQSEIDLDDSMIEFDLYFNTNEATSHEMAECIVRTLRGNQ